MIALDASASLALLYREPGHQEVARHLDQACLSCVNLAEVLSRIRRDGRDHRGLLARIERSPIELVPFRPADAAEVAQLLAQTASGGLSLGDRACLGLARIRGIPALTADRAWADLALEVEIRLLR